MAKKNFTITTVATAPSPATSGTSLVVASGTGSLFAINEPAIVFPVNNQPLVSNAEIVTVTNVNVDTLTITRMQEGTSAREIVAGDIIIQGITAKDWNDLITLVNGKITAFADPNADRIVFWDDSAGAFAALTASTGLTISGTDMTVRSASTTQTGIVELATTAETETGTDATRAVTPDSLHDMTTLAGAAWMLDEDNMASNSDTKVASQQSIKAYVDSKGYTWKGEWVTATAYAVNDTVEYGGSGYICIVAHTSGTFATDLTNGKWEMFVEGVSADSIASTIHGATAKTTPVDADEVGLIDSAASNVLKKLTWSNIKATLKSYFDTVTTTLTNKTLLSPKINEDVALTSTSTELNYVDGVTSAIQTQLNSKQGDIKFTLLASGKVTDTTNGVTISNIGNSGIYLIFTEGWAASTSGKAGFAICSNISGGYGYVDTIKSGTYSGTVTMPSATSINIKPYNGDGCIYSILRLALW